jgi:fibrillarin-like pre-rRNA processing protein
MKETEITGVFKDRKQIFTQNPQNCKGVKVYNEKIVKQKGNEYRSWNPYRSKLAAGILNGLTIDIKTDSNVLYLGAATGTTVSHFSDILQNGTIYAVENSPIAMKKLLKLCEKRQNIIPIFNNANHPDRYSSIVSNVDMVYQDISQRNQAQIFIENANRYLKKNGTGVLMVKARSIDVSLKPSKAYDLVCSEINSSSLKIKNKIDLSPYEKDHMTIVISA